MEADQIKEDTEKERQRHPERDYDAERNVVVI